MKTIRCLAAVLVAALLLNAGCGKEKVEDPKKQRIESLLQGLTSSDEALRGRSVSELGQIVPSEMAPYLDSALNSPRPEVQEYAVGVLRRAGTAGLPVLRRGLSSKGPGVRQASIAALGDFGLAAKDAIPDLIGILKKDQVVHNRREAAKTLGRIGEPSGAVVKALATATLEDSDFDVRWNAANALEKFGWRAYRALRILEMASKNEKASLGDRPATRAQQIIKRSYRDYMWEKREKKSVF